MSVTIYDVAREAGVSTATVSKVLSGQPYVSQPTRAKVMAAVEELSYVPNAAAQGLAGARTNIVGMVITYDPDFLFSDPHLLGILHGVDRVATEHNCAVLLSSGRAGNDQLAAYRRLLAQRYADGAIVDGSIGESGSALLHQQGYPVVAVGYSESFSCVHSDDRGGARQMTEHLLALGHRRIGLICGPVSDRLSTEARLAGHRDALGAADLLGDEELVIYGDFRGPSGYEAAAHLMTLAVPPTAIFAFNDRMALGALRWLQETGLRVPEDVSLAGFDDIPAAAHAEPSLTTMRQQSLEQGSRAASLLFEMIVNGTRGLRREIVLETQLVARGSTAPLIGSPEFGDPSPESTDYGT